jgi:chromosomal replication initiator protein
MLEPGSGAVAGSLDLGRDEVASALRRAISGRVGESRFGLWFGESVSLQIRGERLEIDVPNAFFRDWIRGHFSESLLEAGREVAGRDLELSFQIRADLDPTQGKSAAGNPLGADVDGSPSGTKRGRSKRRNAPETSQPAAEVVAAAPAELASEVPARRPRRLEEFVVGPGNRLALAAALELVERRGGGFNPLVIHGAVGLGKSHLLEGIAHAWRSHRGGMRIQHVTAESFTNGFLDALRTGSLPSFRARYRGADALIVDDIHFIAAKRATQDEFLHTFNALQAKGAPVVLSCDQHPRLVTRLTEELVTRFLGGMVVKLEPPDVVTRKRILETKAAARGLAIPETVLTFIAENLRSSVRELEGALHCVIAHAVLTGKRLDPGLARIALRDTIRHTSRTVGMKDVERAVCSLFGLEAEQLKSESRARNVSYPRMIAMYLSRRHVGAAYVEIGRFFGGRNHSTVISAERKVRGWIEDEKRIHRLDGFESTSEILASLESTLAP